MNTAGGPWQYVGAFHQAAELITITTDELGQLLKSPRKYYYCVKCREWHTC